MSSTIIETPAGAAPGRIVGDVGLPGGQLQPTLREFNRGLFDRSDPLESAGTNLEQFGVSVSYPVEHGVHSVVLAELLATVCTRLRGNSIPGAALRLVDFKDAAAGSEPPRRYVVMEKETVRATHMSVFATFRSYGDFLYVSVDSFILPPLNLMRLLRAMALSFAVFVASMIFLTPFGAMFITVPALVWHFRDVVSSLRQGDTLHMALRRRYHTQNNFGTFNTDDMLVHFKSTLTLAIDGIAEVFEANGIPVDVLNQAKQTINQTTVLNNSGGVMNMIGSAIGGVSNVVTGART